MDRRVCQFEHCRNPGTLRTVRPGLRRVLCDTHASGLEAVVRHPETWDVAWGASDDPRQPAVVRIRQRR